MAFSRCVLFFFICDIDDVVLFVTYCICLAILALVSAVFIIMPPRPRRREGIGIAAIFVFFVFVFFYLRIVLNHASDIRQRRQSRVDDTLHKEQQLRRMVIEDEIEGGIGAEEWDLLRQRTQAGNDNVKENQMAENLGTPTVAVLAQLGTSPQTASSRRTPRPEQATSAPIVPTMPMNNGSASDSRVHSRPLTEKDRTYDANLLPRDIDEGGARLIETMYADVSEHPNDAAFFSANQHVFSHLPLAQSLLKKWQTLNIEMRSGRREKRFVLVHPVGQLCNRLMAITSAAVLALVTKRGLLVDDAGFYAQSSDLFEEPGFSWISTGEHDTSGGHYITNPESGVWQDTESLLCGDLGQAYPQRHIELSINQYLVPYLSNNPHYRSSLQRIFRGSDIFFPVSHFLFRPIPKLVQMRDEYVKRHFKGKFVVGLQVRSGGDFTDHFMTAEDWGLYGSCAAAVVPSSVAPTDVVLFLATDTEKGRAQGAAALSRTASGLPRPVLFSTPTFLLSNHPEGVQMALLDLLLLAAADDRIGTAWSSYGYFSAGYSGMNSNLVVDNIPESGVKPPPHEEQRYMGVPHKSDKRRQCVRLPTHQPCFHKFESWGASKTSCFSQAMFEREMLNGRYC